MKQKGFTLIELLIVVVILGILSAALYPKFSGYLARTRDLQRKMDLQNIATAIQAYRHDTGRLPTRGSEQWTEHSRGTLQASPCLPYSTFANLLNPYLRSVPKDPINANFVKLHTFALKAPNYWYGKYQASGRTLTCDGHVVPRGDRGVAGQPGQYFYQIFQKGGIQMGAAIIVAKVETSDFANYVRFKDIENLQGGLLKRNYSEKISGVWYQKIIHDINELKLCASVEKGDIAKWELQPDGTYKCFYTDEEQLYYILKIE